MHVYLEIRVCFRLYWPFQNSEVSIFINRLSVFQIVLLVVQVACMCVDKISLQLKDSILY